MESLLKTVSIGFLLRSAFAGVFFVLSYQYAIYGTSGFKPSEHPNILTVEVPIALFVGVAVYALHRAYLYPVIEYILDREWAKALRAKKALWGAFPCSLISDTTVDNLYRAWSMAAKDKDKVRLEHARRMTGWADSMHFVLLVVPVHSTWIRCRLLGDRKCRI